MTFPGLEIKLFKFPDLSKFSTLVPKLKSQLFRQQNKILHMSLTCYLAVLPYFEACFVFLLKTEQFSFLCSPRSSILPEENLLVLAFISITADTEPIESYAI